MLVLDESASIVSPGSGLGNQTSVVRTAANGFVDALADTGSELATASFWNFGRPGVNYREVTSESSNIFHNWVNGVAQPGVPGVANPYNPTTATTATNWQDGLLQVIRTGAPDLVVFVTDGDPNTYNNAGNPGGGPPVTTGTTTAAVQTALNNAVGAANTVKGSPAHIFTIGVGPAVTNAASKERLTKVSGTTVFPASAGTPQFPGTDDLTRADFTVVNFDGLKSALTGLVSALCGGRLIITKRVLDHNGNAVQDASGWHFTTTLHPSGGHTWLLPSDAGTDASATLSTDSGGIAEFQWRLHKGQDQVTASVAHTEKHGFHFVVAQCQTTHRDGSQGPSVTSTTGIPGDTPGSPGATLGREDFRTCLVVNRQSTARLTVVKHLEPTNDAGEFNLLINGIPEREGVGHLGSTGPITVPLGTHTVSETAATGTDPADYDTSIRCVDVADNDRLVAHGPGTSLHVHLTNQAEDVVCTITNVSTKFGQLTVIKHLIPESDAGRFNLLVNGTAHATGVGDAGRTPQLRLPFGTHEVTEEAAAGTTLGDYDISTTCIDENTGDTVAHNANGPSVSVDLSRQSNSIVCTITNERRPVKVARLEVVKHLVPNDDAGIFDLLIGGDAFAVGVGHNGSTGTLEFELGKHTVTERAAGLTTLADFSISTTCVDKAHGGHTVAHNANGPSVSVDLSSESDDIVCTITNERTEAPAVGGGEPPATPLPDLAVDKRMRVQARVGALVPITITVHNFGEGTAHGVQVHETPPSGTRIVHVANGGTIQRDGTAVWHLGNLAHGESRTVHATVRVLRTGLHVDTAVATALNADPAPSNAAVHARLAARRPRPPSPPPPVVTG
jgi:uncharacterized repeat protein (TIGR01451 family)